MSHSDDLDGDDLERDAFEEEAGLTPEEEARLGEALRAALAPRDLDASLHERILERALSDPLAPASDIERKQAELLRDALEGKGESDHLALAQALRFAAVPDTSAAAEAAHERALSRALPRRSNVVWATFGAVGGALALAASVTLLLSPLSKDNAPPRERSALARSRSLAPSLNAEAPNLSPSERMDRMASLREKDLRQNLYSKWGLR